MGSRLALPLAAILIASLISVWPSLAQESQQEVAETAPEPAWTYRWTEGSEGTTEVWRRPAAGGQWISAGQIPAAVLAVTATAADADLAVARTADGLYRSNDGGQQWQAMQGLPGWPSAVALSQQTPDLLYVGTLTGGVYLSEDGGGTWQALSTNLGLEPGTFMEVTALTVHPRDHKIVYAATGYWLGTTNAHFAPHGIFLSLEAGQNWLPVHQAQLDEARTTALIPDADAPLIVQARTESGTQWYRLDATALDQQPATSAVAEWALGYNLDGQTRIAPGITLADPNRVGSAGAGLLGQSTAPTYRASAWLPGPVPLPTFWGIGGWMAALAVGVLAVVIAVRSRSGCDGESGSPCN